MCKQNGFTIIELVIVIAIIGITTAIGIPNFLSWLHKYRLESAARDLYANIQRAKMGAMINDASWAIAFNADAGSYEICSGKGNDNSWRGTDNDVIKKVVLSDYGSGVTFGKGSASTPIGGTFGTDFITYSKPVNVLVLNDRGTSNAGYVYLTNSTHGACYGVGTRSNGVIILRQWISTNASGSWE